MAKKRTTIPYYGKENQALDEAAARLTAQGKHEEAKNLREKSKSILKAKKGN